MPAAAESRWPPAAGPVFAQALVLLTNTPSFQAADKGGRKRYEPSDKDRQSPPPAKRANLSPDRGEPPASGAGAPFTLEKSRGPQGLLIEWVVSIDIDSFGS